MTDTSEQQPQPLVSHRDLVADLAHGLDLPRTVVERVLDATAAVITEHLAAGCRVHLRGLGKFESKLYPATRLSAAMLGADGPREAPPRLVPRWRPPQALRRRLAGKEG